MRKIHKNSRIIAGMLVLAIIVTLIPNSTASADVIYSRYIDKNFTWRSAPEKIYLDLDYDSIYLGAVCEGDEPDLLTCHIEDLSEDHPGVYSTTIVFLADGEPHEFLYDFPAGRYNIKFTGRSDIKKTFGAVYFVKQDPLISFNFPWP